jgi:hypothetical protein
MTPLHSENRLHSVRFLGADEEGRTPNLLFTKQLLCH